MSQPIESLARIASTPAEAKIFVAMLAAEGIPARVDGDSLVDEFAASQRLLNLVGTRVMVPTSALQRAKEILQPIAVDADELERAALAAAPEFPVSSPSHESLPTAPTAAAAATDSTRLLLLALLGLAIGAAVLFAFLWHRAVNAIAGMSPDIRLFWDDNVLSEERISDKRLLRRSYDRDLDDIFERIEMFGAGTAAITAYDQYSDGYYLRCVETRPDGLTVTWTDEDRDGLFDVGVVVDRQGKELQVLRWLEGRGLVPSPK